MTSWWDEFANNLSTDLAPLISLFGEAATKQYLSECLTLTDIFICAMAPLGILTVVVSAIRVCGTPALKAFIGRAKEGIGLAEAELCSSTSREVCELFNKGGITRVFGRPKLLEIVHDRRAKNVDFYRTSEADTEGPSAGIHLFKDYVARTEQEWTEVGKSGKALPHKTEEGKSYQRKDFASSPNLSLNVGIKERHEGWFLAAAVLGALTQSSVLVWAAVLRYRLLWLRGDGQDVYGVPLVILGTLLLCSGIFICTLLIERSTKERVFERKMSSIEGETSNGSGKSVFRSEIFWVQPGTQYVGDQAFDSFAYTHPVDKPLTKYMTSWRDIEIDLIGKTPSSSKKLLLAHRNVVSKVWTGMFLSLGGFIMQFIGLRACHPTVAIAQLVAMLIMSFVRAILRTDRLTENENMLDDQDAESKFKGHELDWLAMKLEFDTGSLHPNQSDPGFTTGADCDSSTGRKYSIQLSTGTSSHIQSETQARRLLSGLDILPNETDQQCCIIGFGAGSEHLSPENWRMAAQSETSPDTSDLENSVPSEIARRVLYRARLARMTKEWDHSLVHVRATAARLAKALEGTAKVLFGSDVVFADGWDATTKILWKLDCNLTRGLSQVSEKQGGVYFSLRRNSDATGAWKVDVTELEAILGLWYFSLKHRAGDKRFIRLLSAEKEQIPSSSIAMNLKLWLTEDGGGPRLIQKRTHGTLAASGIDPSRSGSSTNSVESLLFGQYNSGLGIQSGERLDNFYTISMALYSPLLTICAQELYSLFFRAILYSVKSIGGETTIQLSRRFYFLVNTNISDIQKSFVENSLGSAEDALSCIIPVLQVQKKLPTVEATILDAGMAAANDHLNAGRWTDAEMLLLWAISLTPVSELEIESTSQTSRVMRERTINLYRLLLLSLCELYRKAAFTPDASLQKFGLLGVFKLAKEHTSELQDKITLIAPTANGDLGVFGAECGPACYYSNHYRASFCSLAYAVRSYCRAVLLAEKERAVSSVDVDTQKSLEMQLAKKRSGPDEELLDTDSHASFGQSPCTLNYNSDPITCLELACQEANLSDALLILSHIGKNFKSRDYDQNCLNLKALFLASSLGWYVIVKGLIELGTFFDHKSKVSGRTALSFAASGGDCNTFLYLLKRGSSPAVQDNDGRTALFYASVEGHNGIVSLLLSDPRVDPDQLDSYDQTPLWSVAGNCSACDRVVELLLNTVNLKTCAYSVGSTGISVLSITAKQGNEKTMKRLLEKGVLELGEKTLKDEAATLALLYAAENVEDSSEMVSLLLETGKVSPDCCLKSRQYRTPLSFAAGNGNSKIVRLLLETGEVNPGSLDLDHRTPLWHATSTSYENLTIVEMLLQTGKANPNQKSTCHFGTAPLAGAIVRGHDRVVKLLLEIGDVKMNTLWVRDLGSFVSEQNNVVVFSRLLERRERAEKVSRNSAFHCTAFDIAVLLGHYDVVKLLLRTGILELPVDRFGFSPVVMAIASYRGDIEIIRLLVENEQVIEPKYRVTSSSEPLLLKPEPFRESGTLLLFAISFGFYEVVKLLLKVGKMNPNLISISTRSSNSGFEWKFEGTALTFAAGQGKYDIVELLLATDGIDPDLPDSHGRTALSYVAQEPTMKSVRIIDLLLQTGKVDPDSTDESARTPFYYAITAPTLHMMYLQRVLISSSTCRNIPEFLHPDGTEGKKAEAFMIAIRLLRTGKIDLERDCYSEPIFSGGNGMVIRFILSLAEEFNSRGEVETLLAAQAKSRAQDNEELKVPDSNWQ